MGRGKKYTDEYKEMITNLYKSGMTIPDLSSEYGIAKSTISGWVKDNTKIKVSDDEFMSMKEVALLRKEIAKIKEENEILKKAMAIFAKER